MTDRTMAGQNDTVVPQSAADLQMMIWQDLQLIKSHLGLSGDPVRLVEPPASAQPETWLTVSQIAERFDVKPNSVRKAAHRKGFRRHPTDERLILVEDARRQWGTKRDIAGHKADSAVPLPAR